MTAAVITGAGVVSAFGRSVGALFDGLLSGRSAVGPIRAFDASTFPVRVAAEVPLATLGPEALAEALAGLPSADAHIAEWARLGWLRDRKLGFGVLAAVEAWRSAGCGDAERGAWLSLALGLEQAFLEDFDPLLASGRIDWTREPGAPLPPTRFRSPIDLGAKAVASLLGLTGPRAVHVSACAAGGLAVAHAASLVTRGAADVVLCGAADAMINPLGLGGMIRLGAPSPRNEPDACRPFDRRRDGLVMGEGAAVFMVEREDRARARGAKPLARITGWGSTQDAYRATAPRPDGARARAAMERALRRARLAPEAIQYINAHGTGTPLNDPAEAKAIRGAFGAHAGRIAVSSVKGAVGHLMAAAGALELAACLPIFERDQLFGTANLREPDPECNLALLGPGAQPAQVSALLSNSFGFGGQNVSIILERCA